MAAGQLVRPIIVLNIFLSLLPCSAALAASSENDALEYQTCIMDLIHFSPDDVKHISDSQPTLKAKADAIANAAVDSCSAERSTLLADLKAEGKTDEKYYDLVEKIRLVSTYWIKVHILNLAIKSRAPTN